MLCDIILMSSDSLRDENNCFLDEKGANAAFRSTLNESSSRLRRIASQLGKSIEEARPYYDAKERVSSLQSRCQRAAVQYERACQLHSQAKETITVAEQRFQNEPHTDFDAAWQEMLNHATIKVSKRYLLLNKSLSMTMNLQKFVCHYLFMLKY